MADVTSTVPTLTFNNGVEIPQIGYGVFQVDPAETERNVSLALETGYRHIDTAAVYQNEEGVGKALSNAGLPRDQVFVTTKLWNADQGFDSTLRAFDTSMAKLGLDVLDLYLVHWPTPARDLYLDTWRAFERLYSEGRVRAVGVSNFQPNHLRRLFDESDVRPVLNQVELHPYLAQDDLRAFHDEHQVVTEAWSPIGQGRGLLSDPAIGAVAEEHGRTPAQVVLRWHVQRGTVVIPKSVTPERIASNLEVFDFELSREDMATLGGLDRGERLGPDPDAFEVA
jgi:diketogulonate reductase-like aldo/keto reductase